MQPKIDLQAKHYKIVVDILSQIIPNHEVIVFGSRATGKAKRMSDLDLCIIAKENLSFKTLAELADAFDESLLPFKVDIVEWLDLDETFRKIIQHDGIKLC